MRSKIKMDMIRGAGGGGGGQSSTPVEQPDSLHSRDTAYLLDGLCEGEIEGLVDGLKSVYLDGTPVQNSNGTYNFKNLTVYSTKGTQAQPYIPLFPEVVSETPVGVKVANGMPIVRSMVNPSANACRVRLSTPTMFSQDDAGNTNGTTIQFTIEVQSNGGGYVLAVSDSFSGKTTTKYDRAYKIKLSGTGPWDIRVSKVTADSTSSSMRNDLYFESFASVIDQKLRMPNTALIGMSVDSRVFQNIPTRSYRVRGTRVKIPSNYDPVLRTCSGVWDGTFRIAWTDNPAWCFYDLVTNTRYGLGKHVPAELMNKWALYQIAQYCDEMVPDGMGGTEPRFRLNCYIQTLSEALTLLNSIASTFRAMVCWEAGQVSAVQDAPRDPVALFTAANVIDGEFSYTGASRRQIHNVAMVTWNDPDDHYRQKVEYVPDQYGIQKNGVIKTDVVAYGCASRGQAHRIGKWLLYTERFESESVAFSVGLDGSGLRPGDVVSIHDPHRAGKRLGGRLKSVGSSVNALAIDKSIAIEAGKTYVASVVLPDGNIGSAVVANSVGSTDVLALATPLAQVPVAQAIWMVAASDLPPETWSVISVAETAKNLYQVNAVKHYPGKFALIEQDIALQFPPTSAINTNAPNAPQNLTLSEDMVRMQGIVRTRMIIAWDAVQRASSYRISWRPRTGNWEQMPDTLTTHMEVIDPPTGEVEVRLQAIGVLGQASAPVTKSIVLLGKTAPPSDVTGFMATRKGNDIHFSWNPVPDLDVHHYEIRLGGVWETALEIANTARTALAHVSPQGGTFLIRAFDTSGNPSRNAASFALDANANVNVVLTDDDAAYGFTGTMTNMAHDGATITLAYHKVWNDWTLPWNSYTRSWMLESDPFTTGSYETDMHDLGKVLSSHFSVAPQLDVIPLGDSWAAWTQPWSYYSNGWTWYGPVGAVSATFEIDTSLDGLLWTGWQPFSPGLRTCRYFKMRASFNVQLNYQVRLNSFPISVDVPDRAEHFANEAIPAIGKTINFAQPFTYVGAVSVTLLDGAAGDTYTVNKTLSGITVQIFDSTNTAKAGKADIVVPGY